MGLLVDGVWRDRWYDTKSSAGRFIREDARFRNWITGDGRPGRTGTGGFQAERDRYHLFVSLACPWAHRTLIFRTLKGLGDIIGITVVHPHMLENGWEFEATPDTPNDAVNGFRYLYQVYTAVDPEYSGHVTVPVLWDKKTKTIVSNESSEIIRMFNSAFDRITGNSLDFYPQRLRAEIDTVNERVYANVNNGVYRAGFATTQEAYESAFDELFETLDWLDARLETQRYLVGGQITEADWRLFTTLIRFDAVYHGHFKVNLKRIEDYQNLPEYMRELYQVPGVSKTVSFDHIKQHYYVSQRTINPTQVVPKGPVLDLDRPHGRAIQV
ncbi:MAG: glutathione-dependent reductase [Rhodospirillaceae bacterium]|jgi:putative glutathione S-transferase|nr:glutathione-dependent reductase [Rhodospirillaceae bacterium]|tara:strand:- start:2445 stop:3425 length:981 start_codon:yes stop_codon:yes gene_type:complete